MTANDRVERTLAELQPYIERARSFSGWSFGGALRSRRLDPGEPWDYESIAREYIDDLVARAFSPRILDLGTGGGEVLARIIGDPPEGNRAGGMDPHIVATEEWHVNAPVAHRRLSPLGVEVAHASSLALPFADGAFDLVLDRHEELDPAGVARALARGGVVITQQCGPDNWREIRTFFSRAAIFEDHYDGYAEGFIAAGLEIVRRERCEFRTAFRGLGDITFLLITAPWTVPDFDPARDIEALLALEDELGTPDGIVLTETRYLLIARKPEALPTTDS